MDITNFRHVRVGSGYPAVLDVSPIGSHESEGVYASFPVVSNGLPRAELRYKEGTYALFVFRYANMDYPEWWKDSELVWSLF